MFVRVDKRGRITLPAKIREKLELKENDMLMLDINEDGLLIGNPIVAVPKPKDFSKSEVVASFDNPEDLNKYLSEEIKKMNKESAVNS